MARKRITDLSEIDLREELSGKAQRKRAIKKAYECKDIDIEKTPVRLSTYYHCLPSLDCYVYVDKHLSFKEIQERLADLTIVINYNLKAK